MSIGATSLLSQNELDSFRGSSNIDSRKIRAKSIQWPLNISPRASEILINSNTKKNT